jgi:hypothetical protein
VAAGYFLQSATAAACPKGEFKPVASSSTNCTKVSAAQLQRSGLLDCMAAQQCAACKHSRQEPVPAHAHNAAAAAYGLRAQASPGLCSNRAHLLACLPQFTRICSLSGICSLHHVPAVHRACALQCANGVTTASEASTMESDCRCELPHNPAVSTGQDTVTDHAC